MTETKQEIRYDDTLVGWRRYRNGQFIGYTWDEIAYQYYEMFVARRKIDIWANRIGG